MTIDTHAALAITDDPTEDRLAINNAEHKAGILTGIIEVISKLSELSELEQAREIQNLCKKQKDPNNLARIKAILKGRISISIIINQTKPNTNPELIRHLQKMLSYLTDKKGKITILKTPTQVNSVLDRGNPKWEIITSNIQEIRTVFAKITPKIPIELLSDSFNLD